jgi:hypothetical protein
MLTSSNPSVLSVPATLTVNAGNIYSPIFVLSTTQVTTSTQVTLTATLNGVSKTVTVTVNPITPIRVSLSKSSITGGLQMNGSRVYLTGPGANDGSTVITLTSSDPAIATVPASITAAPGATSQPFSVATSAVASATSVTITATINGVSRNATFTVNP